ncbi:hypothetical protein CB1_000811009 [Camelus ferus]|nr:hypothetical protein CB1_000811009 [Camelus ferus]
MCRGGSQDFRVVVLSLLDEHLALVYLGVTCTCFRIHKCMRGLKMPRTENSGRKLRALQPHGVYALIPQLGHLEVGPGCA